MAGNNGASATFFYHLDTPCFIVKCAFGATATPKCDPARSYAGETTAFLAASGGARTMAANRAFLSAFGARLFAL